MAYTKTNWQNGQAPAVNATNLNKMEQGIEDAHNAANFGFKTVDAGGNGDYLTIEAALSDSEYKLFLKNGTHVISNQTIIPFDTEVILEGESKSGAIVDFNGVNAPGGGIFRVADDVGDLYNKWSNTGTYTRSGKTITYTGTTPADMSTLFSVGDLIIIGNEVGGDGAASIITRITSSQIEFDNFALSSTGTGYLDMGWVWSIGQAKFTARNLTLDSGQDTETVLNKSADSLGYWDAVFENVQWLGQGYPMYDYDSCWRVLFRDCNTNSHFFHGSRAYIENCQLEKTYLDAPKYGGDAKYVSCTIAEDAGGDMNTPYVQMIGCTFMYDLSTSPAHGNNATKAKVLHCIDVNGLYTQPTS
jgi:hypothetical protein